MRRSLSALLNSRRPDPLIDDDPKFLNNLHSFETTHVQKVSQCAPHKGPRPFSSLRQGRDPRTKTRRPFLTYEAEPLTEAQQHKFELKQCHMKVMTDRVQYYNKAHFVPKSKQSGSEAALPPFSPEELNDFYKTPEIGQEKENQVPSTNSKEVKMPSQIIEDLYCSNVGDIIKSMSIHDQMRTIHNIMQNEEFKKEQKRIAQEQKEEQKRQQEEAEKKIAQQLQDAERKDDEQLSEECWGSDCLCSKGDAKELRIQQQQLEEEKAREIEKKKHKQKVKVKEPKKDTRKWQVAEDYVPESQRSHIQKEQTEEIQVGRKLEYQNEEFYNMPAIGDLDAVKQLKMPQQSSLDGLKKMPILLTKKQDALTKQEGTKDKRKWQRAESLQRLSKEDREKIETYEKLKQQRNENEMEIVKKFIEEDNKLVVKSIGNSPVRGDHGHPDNL